MKKETMVKLAKFVLRMQRGAGHISFITSKLNNFQQAFILLTAVAGWIYFMFGVEIKSIRWIIIVLTIVAVILIIIKWIASYYLGRWDERHGFWKIQNRYITEELDPYHKEMGERLKRIEKQTKRQRRY